MIFGDMPGPYAHMYLFSLLFSLPVLELQQHGGGVVSAATSQLEGSHACSPRACMSFLQFPPTILRHTAPEKK